MAVVYNISCLDESVKECYIGSTIDFKNRMWGHKHSCNNENSHNYNQPLYQFIRENGGWGAWKMTIIDSLTTIDKNVIEKCERKYVEEQEFRLNKELPSRTPKEYYEDNREKLLEQKRQYRQDHKEESKQYYQDHKESALEYQKQYRQDHKEKASEHQKQYRKEKVTCACGSVVNR